MFLCRVNSVKLRRRLRPRGRMTVMSLISVKLGRVASPSASLGENNTAFAPCETYLSQRQMHPIGSIQLTRIIRSLPRSPTLGLWRCKIDVDWITFVRTPYNPLRFRAKLP